jgi:hypothetical protein
VFLLRPRKASNNKRHERRRLFCSDVLLRRLAPQASLAGRTAMRRKREGRWGEVPKSGDGTPTYPTS